MNHTVYQVADPEEVRARVGLFSKWSVTMMVEATKLRDSPMFATPPIQSDYAALWESGSREETIPALARALKQKIPFGVKAMIVGHRKRRKFSFGNKAFYTRRRLRIR
jgi:hypothetical protein